MKEKRKPSSSTQNNTGITATMEKGMKKYNETNTNTKTKTETETKEHGKKDDKIENCVKSDEKSAKKHRRIAFVAIKFLDQQKFHEFFQDLMPNAQCSGYCELWRSHTKCIR